MKFVSGAQIVRTYAMRMMARYGRGHNTLSIVIVY